MMMHVRAGCHIAMANINILLNFHGYQVPFLSIPLSDVQRLSIHPFKWLRFVMFSICGAVGDLSATPDGPPVNYDSISLADIIYFYTPSGDCIFVDYEGLNDRETSTEQTHRGLHFRRDVRQRDGCCIITQERAEDCDAAHLIPRSKGDEYIQRVVQDRSPLYGHTSIPSISGIDAIENGVFLSKLLHSKFGRGDVAFLMTPNFVSELDPTDIHRFEQGSTGTDYYTLQQLKKPDTNNPVLMATLKAAGSLDPFIAFRCGAHVDALFQGTGSSLPPAVIVDYMYGVAAYKCWMSRQGDPHSVMRDYRTAHYANIPVPPRRPASNDDDDTSPEEPDDSDADYNPNDEHSFDELSDCHDPENPSPTSPRRRHYTSTRRGGVLVKAMDEMNSLIRFLQQGVTPQEAASRREKRMEEEELKAQEAGRSKVMEWMKTTEVGGSCL